MPTHFHTTQTGHRIAYQHLPGSAPGVLFCCGFRSDMESTKASTLAAWCEKNGVGFTRFDYHGHGQSEMDFAEFRIGKAASDALEILDHVAHTPQLIVGSSMGGWVGLLAALARPEKVCGLIGVAAAPDFTDRLMRARMNDAQRAALEAEGVVWVYSESTHTDYPISQEFLNEARTHLVLDDLIPLEIPIHLFHGQADADVPWETALVLANQIVGRNVNITLIKDGDHRLNREQDLALLTDAVAKMLGVPAR